jgi:hypothetical protein
MGLNALKQHEVAVWALLQHYGVCTTPLLDVTRSARVAASFALAETDTDGFIYAIGLPYLRDNISIHYAEELMTLNLRGLLPPIAARPHFQEGYLVGTIPGLNETPKGCDLARRSIGKFRIPDAARASFFPVGNTAVAQEYLLPTDDPMARWLCGPPEHI